MASSFESTLIARLEQLVTDLRMVRSGTSVAIAVLRQENTQVTTDVALILEKSVHRCLVQELERIAELIALLKGRLTATHS